MSASCKLPGAPEVVSWELEQETSEDLAGVGVVEEPAARPQGSSAVREASWVVGEHAEVLVDGRACREGAR